MKKILLILGIILLNLSLVFAVKPTVDLVAFDAGSGVHLVATALDNDISYINIYENSILVGTKNTCVEGFPCVFVLNKGYPITGSADYYARAVNLGGEVGVSETISLNLAPVIITGPFVIELPTEVTITWNTDELSDSKVKYGRTSGIYTLEKYDNTQILSHSMTLTGLIEGETYYYIVESKDANNKIGRSLESSFIPRNINAPIITNVISNVDITVDPTEITITWTTDEISDSRVRYGVLSGTYANERYDSITGLSHSITLVGLNDDTTYYFIVESTDLDVPANTGKSGEHTFDIPDLTEPVISNINIADLTLTSAEINWNTDELSNSRVRYGILSGTYDNNVEDLNYVKNHNVLLTNLVDGQTYYYIVESDDVWDNTAVSSENSFTTGDLIISFREPDDDDEFYVGSTINGELRVTNTDINDVDVDVEIMLYDNTDDDEIVGLEFDKEIDAGDYEDFEFNIDLPYNLDDGNDYELYAEVTADGVTYKQTIDLDMNRKSNDVKIDDMRIYQNKNNVEVSVSVLNQGKKDQEEVYIEVKVYGLGINLVSENFKLGSWDDSEHSTTKRFVFDKPSEGLYTVEASVFYGSASDYVTKDFEIKDEKISVESGNTQFIQGSIQSVSQAEEKPSFELLTVKNITWGIVDFLLLVVVIYLFSQLIRYV